MNRVLGFISFVAFLFFASAQPLLAQCPAASFPYTDSFGATGAMSPCWKAVVGPSSSISLVQASGIAIPSASGGYGVEMFTGAPVGVDGCIQAAVKFASGNYPTITLDQDANGGAIALEPSLDSIFDLEANSGAASGAGPLCYGTGTVSSGDVLKLCKATSIDPTTGTSSSSYAAADVTTGQAICVASSSTHKGYPGIQVDWRSTGDNTSSVGPVTITLLAAAAPAAATLVSCPLPAVSNGSPTMPATPPNCAPIAGSVLVSTDGATVTNLQVSTPVFFQYCAAGVCDAPFMFIGLPLPVGPNAQCGGPPVAGSTSAGALYMLPATLPNTVDFTDPSGAAHTLIVPVASTS